MQISSRFTIAVHVLVCIETFKDSYKVTSDFLASSVNVNPVVIRRLLQQLKKAGLINVKRGSGGADIEKPLDEITLLDLYNVSYELNYLIYDMPFYITNDYGGITFKNKNVNAIAQKFAKELMRIYSQPASDIIRKYPKKAEFIKAQNEINEYNRRCAIVDSIYTDAELKIAPRFNATIDSLKQEKRKLRIKQEMLISRQNQSQK